MHRSETKVVTQVHFQPLKPSIQCGHTSKVHSLFKDLVFPGPNHCAHSFSDLLFLVHPTIAPPHDSFISPWSRPLQNSQKTSFGWFRPPRMRTEILVKMYKKSESTDR